MSHYHSQLIPEWQNSQGLRILGRIVPSMCTKTIGHGFGGVAITKGAVASSASFNHLNSHSTSLFFMFLVLTLFIYLSKLSSSHTSF